MSGSSHCHGSPGRGICANASMAEGPSSTFTPDPYLSRRSESVAASLWLSSRRTSAIDKRRVGRSSTTFLSIPPFEPNPVPYCPVQLHRVRRDRRSVSKPMEVPTLVEGGLGRVPLVTLEASGGMDALDGRHRQRGGQSRGIHRLDVRKRQFAHGVRVGFLVCSNVGRDGGEGNAAWVSLSSRVPIPTQNISIERRTARSYAYFRPDGSVRKVQVSEGTRRTLDRGLEGPVHPEVSPMDRRSTACWFPFVPGTSFSSGLRFVRVVAIVARLHASVEHLPALPSSSG